MAPIPGTSISLCLTGGEETDAQRNDHEEVAREAVAVGEGPGNGRNSARPVQVEYVAVAGEEFEYPVQGLEYAHEENGDNEVMYYPVSVIGQLPVDEKQEQARERQPLEELDLCGKGEKAQSRGSWFVIRGACLRISDFGFRVLDFGSAEVRFPIHC